MRPARVRAAMCFALRRLDLRVVSPGPTAATHPLYAARTGFESTPMPSTSTSTR
jgi:hypothetical protein